MATFSITPDVMSVNAAFLDIPAQLPLVAVANACEHDNYFHCVSKNTALHRLLVDEQFAKVFGTLKDALRKSDILKTLKALKDAEWANQVQASCDKMKDPRYTTRTNRATILSLPATVAIVAPQVLTVESKTLIVVLNAATKCVVMLLPSEALEYLRDVATAQLLIGGCQAVSHVRTNMSAADRVDTTVANLYWSYKKRSFRAVFHPPDEDGKKQRRREYYTESRRRALTFVETGVRFVDTESGNDDEYRSSPEPSEEGDGDEAASTGNDG